MNVVETQGLLLTYLKLLTKRNKKQQRNASHTENIRNRKL